MISLNFPTYNFRFKSSENKVQIFDVIRKKFVVLQPEEWVRQHVLHQLIYDKNYPKSLINVEKQLLLNGLKKRYDVVVYNSDGSIKLLVECKAHNVPITKSVFDQIARYNMDLKASFLMVTNGLQHYYCQMDYDNRKYRFLEDIPKYVPVS
ncbi:MAG: type I restriction enzyme HsdR N-terminal domain-containing protein [Eudoraea sp.]|nr:type I restriction enzyme HsdR N-terminal domain-containing protein [Eudoraea sp.]